MKARRGRPLGEARLIFETGAKGAGLRALRDGLGLDSGYLSRLLRSLEAQDLVTVESERADRRRRRVRLTSKGRAELAAYDRLSDELAASMLAPLDGDERERLVAAMAEIERLIRAATIVLRVVSPSSAAVRRCLAGYFRELAARFEGGFNLGEGDLTSEEQMTPPSGFFVLAQIDGRAVGCGGLRRIDKRVGEIKRMWTAPEARGHGVARRVLHKLEALARGAGIETLRLDTNRVLVEAQAMYRRKGFREIARYDDNPYAHHWRSEERRVGKEC